MKRAVHTLLFGDPAAAAKRLPFAQAKLQAMFAELRHGRRHVVRHFTIEGDSIDLWADALGGRIHITAALLGTLREFGSLLSSWKLFDNLTLSETAAGRVLLADMADVTAFFPKDATAKGFLAGENRLVDSLVQSDIVMHAITGARLWTFDDFAPVDAVLPGNDAFMRADGACLSGDFAIIADGAAGTSQTIYTDYPFDLSIIGYQFYASSLRYVCLDVADGTNLITAPTKEATLWGAPEAAFVPTRIASCAPLFSDFHVIGYLLKEGTDEEDDRLHVDTYELHYLDATDLSLLGDVALTDTPVDVVADDQGTVYVGYGGEPSRYEAYSRALVRDTSKDFIDIASANLPFSDEGPCVAIIGEFLYSRVKLFGVIPTLKKINRTGVVVAESTITTDLAETNQALIQLRR